MNRFARLIILGAAQVALVFLLAQGCEALIPGDGDAQGADGNDGGCESGFTIGTGTPAGGGAIGQTCNSASSPTNCSDGSFIRFSDGECVCISRCAASSPCGSSAFTCQQLSGEGTYCVSRSWGLCGAQDVGGADGVDGFDGNDGTVGGDTGTDGNDGQCLPTGNPCSQDQECCSDVCFSGGCG